MVQLIMDTAQEFLQLAVDKQVLKFGEFTLKSGRVSPYFFNAGLFDDGASLAQLGRFYAQTIVDSGVEFDMLPVDLRVGVVLVQQEYYAARLDDYVMSLILTYVTER